MKWRWLVLITVLAGIGWTGNWSYHQVDNAILITDFWKADNPPKEWGIVNFKEGSPVIYDYVGTRGLWEIFKALWPVWGLFSLSFFVLIPLSILTYNRLNNTQISEAREALIDAKKRIEKAKSDAKDYERRAKDWAEERVRTAYQEQLERVQKELETEWNNFYEQEENINQRERKILEREMAAERKQAEAQEKIEGIQKQYHQERERFEAELHEMAVAKNNAQAGYQRIKRKR